MSKQSLQKTASERSGVTFEESTEATSMKPSLYERIGVEGIRELSTRFYDKVFDDKEALWFLNIFSSSTRSEAIENQYLFFVQTFGGPALYANKKGKYTRLVGRHANYTIGAGAADRWVFHMTQAIEEHPLMAEDMEAKQKLEKYFRYTAHYIVVASEYMRPDQLSGGTQIDSGRIWLFAMCPQTHLMYEMKSVRGLEKEVKAPYCAMC
eukprot:scaffold5138_cov170-Amphora_coffeaeformis.AAC.3